jgi:hypothetical protein
MSLLWRLGLHPFRNERKHQYKIVCHLRVCTSVHPAISILDKVNDFYEIWYKHHAVAFHSNLKNFHFLQLVLREWRACEIWIW